MPQSSTYILDSIINKKKEQREQMRCELLKKLQSVLDEMHAVITFDEAYIFGSIIRHHQFSENSDIDIGFIGLDDKDFFKVMSFLSSRLGCEVDVVQLENHRFEAVIRKEGIQWKKKG